MRGAVYLMRSSDSDLRLRKFAFCFRLSNSLLKAQCHSISYKPDTISNEMSFIVYMQCATFAESSKICFHFLKA